MEAQLPHDLPDDWTADNEAMFTRIYRHMLASPQLFVHPKAPTVDPEHWLTTAWNAAWFAVMAARGGPPVEIQDSDGSVFSAELTSGELN